ncbi:MAG: hypothetical protein H6571_18795 [Lewinellaceae bacterium]|nr:hypothetical protein [Lewinellaceae bacterium]
MKKLQTPNIIIIALSILLALGFSVSAQNTGMVSVRFSNPQYDQTQRTYCLDVDLQSNVQGQRFDGMNVRFFYDATKMDFLNIANFHEGVGPVNPNPARVTEGAAWGYYLFNLESSANAVNGAVQVINPDNYVTIPTDGWMKFFEVCFEVKESIPVNEDFCPSVIWDLKTASGKGGFLTGSGGVVITTYGNNPSIKDGKRITASQHFNWEGYADQGTPPFGVPIQENCISLTGSVTGIESTDAKKFELFQNQPNPFDEFTEIRFTLPEASAAKLTFFDGTGKSIKLIEGDYAAGMNVVKVKSKDFHEVSTVLFYRLETPAHKSVFKKMIFLR